MTRLSLGVGVFFIATIAWACGGAIAPETSSGTGSGGSGGSSGSPPPAPSATGSSSFNVPAGPTAGPPPAPPPGPIATNGCSIGASSGHQVATYPDRTFALPTPPCPSGMAWNGTFGGIVGGIAQTTHPIVYASADMFDTDFCAGPAVSGAPPGPVDFTTQDLVAVPFQGSLPGLLTSIDGTIWGAVSCFGDGRSFDNVAFYAVPKGAAASFNALGGCTTCGSR